MERVVVVGASVAGLRAAEAARRTGFDGELVLVGAERHPPYHRPPLSKALLAGAIEPEANALRHELEADWRLGTRATALDTAAREVALEDGTTLAYDGLVLATGSSARPWPGPSPTLDGVLLLRELDDALALRAAAAARPRVVIVGAGFVGCEVAATLRTLGLDVALVDLAEHPMPALGPELGALCGEIHAEHGVELLLGRTVEAFEGDGRLERVRLGDGTVLEAGLALIATGSVPNTAWLAGSGLEVDPAVVCDATCAALGAPEVVCAGDIARWPHPLAGGELVRVEHWSNAMEQGRAAGANVVRPPGERQPYAPVPSFWSDQYDVKIQSLGFPELAERTQVLEGSVAERAFVAVGERDGHVVSAIGFNAMRSLPRLRRHVAEASPLAAIAAG